MSNNKDNLTVATASNGTKSVVSLPTLVGGSSASSITIDSSSVISLDDGTPVKLYVDRFQKAHHEALEKITDWLVETQKAELAKGYMCSWSKIVCGFEIRISFMDSGMINSAYDLYIEIKSVTESGRTPVSKHIFFSTDNAVYDWFKQHDIHKLIDSLEESVKEYFKAYSNLNTVIDLELSL
jgi:hypothetical protein